MAGETTLSDIVSAKVGQKYALDKIAGNTRTYGTKSWQPGFYKADLGAKTLYFISLIGAKIQSRARSCPHSHHNDLIGPPCRPQRAPESPLRAGASSVRMNGE